MFQDNPAGLDSRPRMHTKYDECLRTRPVVPSDQELLPDRYGVCLSVGLELPGPESIRRMHVTPPSDAEFGWLRSELTGAG
jgi:hypothetical protein